MKADRVDCDTNVLISAAIMPTGKARQAINFVIDTGRLVIFGGAVQRVQQPSRPAQIRPLYVAS